MPLLTPEQAAAEFDIPSGVLERLASDGMIDAHYVRDGRKQTLHVSSEDAGAVGDARDLLREEMKAGRAPLIRWGIPRSGLTGVYYVAGGEFLKIGMAQCIRSRFAGLKTSSPLDLQIMGWEPTLEPRARERELHQQFEKSRGIGEWFRFTDDLRRHLGQLTEFYFGLRGEVQW